MTKVATNATTPATAHAHDHLCQSVADLLPAIGLGDRYDQVIFSLCDTSFITPDITGGAERFCHQIRHASNADTVYLCDRQQLRITTTTSACNDTGNEDTTAIHRALTTRVHDLQHCDCPVQLPDLHAFTDDASMPVCVIPVGKDHQLLAVVVDHDAKALPLSQYCADAIDAIYQCQTSLEFEGFAPTTRQIQCRVFDALNRSYKPCSREIQSRRFALFIEDLSLIDVQFEKIYTLEKSDKKNIWGWQVVANHLRTDQVPTALYLTAEEWTKDFRTALDQCLLDKAAHRYKEVCEAANLTRNDEIKPICLNVYPQTLQSPEYINLLTELTEKFVLQGTQLVFEISDTMSLSAEMQNAEQHLAPQMFAQSVKLLREELKVRVALNEYTANHLGLSGLLCLEPDLIKTAASVAKTPIMTMLKQISKSNGGKTPLAVFEETESPTQLMNWQSENFRTETDTDVLSTAG